MSFFNYAFNNFIDKDNLLFKVDKIIDWNEISDLLYKTLGKQELQPVTGRDPYNYLSLFKILLIQQWHNLSDAKVEEALRTRIDFMWFTQLGFATRDFMVPDETTICRFRNKVIKHKILDKLLQMINASLVLNNLKVKSSQGAILDATLIESSVNSKAIPNLIVEDRQENLIHNDANHNSNSMKVLKPNEQSDIELDKDAKWLKKGKRTVFGYKNFVLTDSTDGYIETVDTTPANVSEINHLETLLDKLNYTPQVLFADKGYASKNNIDVLKSRNIGNGIMDKAVRNKALTKKQLDRNKRISKTRFIVERTNATTTTRFSFRRSRYIGLIKVHAQSFLVALAHNLLKAANKIKLLDKDTRIIPSRVCNFELFA